MIKSTVIRSNAYVRNSSLEMADDDSNSVEFVISSEAVDTYGTVFRMDGWDLSRYKNNPIVCYQHRSNSDDPDDIIGTSEVFVQNDQLIARVTFDEDPENQKAQKVKRKVLNGILKMASVGAHVKDGRMGDKKRGEDPEVIYFTNQELIEWSIVSAGANPDALKRNEQTIEEIRNEAIKNIEVIEESHTKPLGQSNKKKRSVIEAQLNINQNL
ncbi:HK97 family phage prohead protease [Lutibacter holmesii]|uniref:HK97 family phage prohead protease n=1 Tax=Lutibacter holmesii TaxID=1137985 RepID=A0ABW3WJP1_9FLAO